MLASLLRRTEDGKVRQTLWTWRLRMLDQAARARVWQGTAARLAVAE